MPLATVLMRRLFCFSDIGHAARHTLCLRRLFYVAAHGFAFMRGDERALRAYARVYARYARMRAHAKDATRC